MKRNSKFLLLLAIVMSGIIGVYFIGCDEETVNNPIADEDRVIGSVHGVVANDVDNMPVPNVQVTWVNKGETHTVTTDTGGYFMTTGVLGSGSYEFTFSVNTYAVRRAFDTIPTVTYVRGQDPDAPAGDMPWSETLDVDLFPLNAGVTGMVFTDTVLGAPGKDIGDPMAADGDPAQAAVGVEVVLEYGWDIVPNKYWDTTSAAGLFNFTNVPCAPDSVQLTVLPFTWPSGGDSSYKSVTVDVELIPKRIVDVGKIYAPLDCTDLPQVLLKNFSEAVDFNYYDTLKVTFSKPMDTISFSVELDPPTTVDLSWSWDDKVLEIDPFLTLLTDTDYEITLSGKSRDGCPTDGRTWSFNFTTEDGIALDRSNLEEDDFIPFPIDSPIVLTFTMTPVIDPILGELRLDDWTEYPTTFRVGIDSQVVGNDLIVTPDNPLERDHTYRLTYTMLSAIQGDYVSGYLEFATEFDTIPPDTVQGFALDMGAGWTADWNDTLIDFRWDKVDNATGYRIYAWDNKGNTDFIVVGDFDQKDYEIYQTGTVDLPTQFDLYDDDVGLQTPFSGGTVITFDIRAYNRAGEGPFTVTDAIPVADETPPSFTVSVSGNADNLGGTEDSVLTFEVDGIFYEDGTVGGDMLEYCQETSNPVFVFTEAGGDSAYVLPATAGDWTWDADLRDGSGTITVPAGMMAAGDSLVLQIADNSGKVGEAAFRLLPTIDFVTPNATDTTFEAPTGMIDWTIANAIGGGTITAVNLYISWDDGTTWIDTLPGINALTISDTAYAVDDTLIVDGTGLIGIENADGGFRWLSEAFTVNGIMLTGPDSASYFANQDTILDGGNTDSTEVPVAWNSTAFISEVVISYFYTGAPNWVETDTIVNTGSFNFVPPSRGAQYNCWLRVADADSDGRPRDTTSWYFTVLHDTIEYIKPFAGDVAPGGSIVYNIRWDNGVGFDLPSLLDIDYAVDAATDTNWLSVVTLTENDGFHTWDTVPYASPSTEALIKIEAQDGTEYISDFFTISGLTITAPVGGEDWPVGSSRTITWNNIGGFSGSVDIDYSIDNGATWSGIVSNEPNIGSYPWNPIPNVPSDSCLIRVEENGGLITDTSDSVFTISGIIVDLPNGGETWLVGRFDSVLWRIVGDVGPNVGIAYSIDSGTTFDSILTASEVANSGKFIFTVAALAGPFPIDSCFVEVYDASGGTATDTSDVSFTIDQPNITVTDPDTAGIAWQQGTLHDIKWTSVGLQADSLVIALDTNTTQAGGYSIEVARVPASATSYSWTIPNVGLLALPNCKIRVGEIGYPLNDVSDNNFQIDP